MDCLASKALSLAPMGKERGMTTKSKPIIGFLAGRFDEAYQNAVWRGATSEAARVGADLVFFGGQRLGSPIGYEALDNIAFDLAEHSRMAGLVVLANVIGTYLSAEEQLAFIGRFGGSGVVTIGTEFPGIPSVRVDASGGMSWIAEHLVRVHSRRRFLFLAGPRGHIESEARKAEFLRALSALAPSQGRVDLLYSDFTDEDAEQKVALFLRSGHRVDAVVAANDRMANGAMRALAREGIDVPREVSVTGFDDTEDSRFLVPPLTTVRQPTAELGRMAVNRIAAKLGLVGQAGEEEPPVSFVVRESCGCRYSPESEDESLLEDSPRGDGKKEAGDVSAAPDGLDPLAALSAEINREIREGRNPGKLRRRAFSPELREEALTLVAEGERRFLASQRYAADRRVTALGDIEASLVSSFRMEDILGQIARGARELGISGCWLSLFASTGAALEWSKLFLSADARGTRILAPYGMRFRTSELVPGGLPGSPAAYVCEPLRFGDDRLGYLVCTADSSDPRLYEALRDQVSSALKGAMLMSAERDRERSLERNVRARTIELSAANARLVDEIARRKNLEKEILSVSNRIMGKIGQDIHDNLCQDIAGLGLMAAILEGKLRAASESESDFAALAAQEASDIAKVAGSTAAQAKDIARGLYPAELEARGIVPAVERLVRSTQVRGGSEIKMEVTHDFSVRDSEKALQIYRIVQESLANAVRHSKASNIKVGLYMDRETVTAEVSDDGCGIPAGASDEGGMGLHILKYRASVIGGELRIRSNDSGTTISCRIPR
jgi:signal transduction histidine kinase/DNA-binding LacI/PurR family transcriptional regulator